MQDRVPQSNSIDYVEYFYATCLYRFVEIYIMHEWGSARSELTSGIQRSCIKKRIFIYFRSHLVLNNATFALKKMVSSKYCISRANSILCRSQKKFGETKGVKRFTPRQFDAVSSISLHFLRRSDATRSSWTCHRAYCVCND